MSRSPNKGINFSRYDEMIKTAFHERWWNSPKLIRVNSDGTTTVVPKKQGTGDDNLGPNDYALGPVNMKAEAPLAGVDHGPPLNSKSLQ